MASLDPEKLCKYCAYRNNPAPGGLAPSPQRPWLLALGRLEHRLRTSAREVKSADYCGYCACNIERMVAWGKPCPLRTEEGSGLYRIIQQLMRRMKGQHGPSQ